MNLDCALKCTVVEGLSVGWNAGNRRSATPSCTFPAPHIDHADHLELDLELDLDLDLEMDMDLDLEIDLDMSWIWAWTFPAPILTRLVTWSWS